MVAHRLLGQHNVGPAQRIVSLASSISDSLAALGLSDRVVGVTTNCDLAPTTERMVVGTHARPDLEAIRTAGPDLIVTLARTPVATLHEMAEHAAPVLVLDLRAVADVLTGMQDIADLADVDGRAVIGGLKSRVERIRHLVSAYPPPCVLRLMSADSIRVPTPLSFQYDAMLVAGE